jgi:hypothetical protein
MVKKLYYTLAWLKTVTAPHHFIVMLQYVLFIVFIVTSFCCTEIAA